MLKQFDVIIIGAGPAGLVTAINVRKGNRILVLEKNDSAGKKLLMSGSGKCNVTQSGNIDDFSKHFGENFRFLIPALKEFTNNDLIAYLKAHNLNTFIDKNGKVFPASEKASDVLNILLNHCQSNRVAINYNEDVKSIEKQDGRFIVKTHEYTYQCKNLVIANGGMSYPSTGSTGDGYIFAKALGHTIEKPKPALTPVMIKHYRFKEISGVSLEQRKISLFRDNKKIKEHIGNFGFTHWGLSGPGILDFSRYIEVKDTLKINLIDRNPEKFRSELNETAIKDGKQTIKKFLKSYDLPESLIRVILTEISLDSTVPLAAINKVKRNKLIELFCEYPFVIDRVGDYNIAMVTNGGVSLKEVSPKSMESKIVKGLFFVGEVLDIDGDTGGYNIQAAFSTGFLAGKNL